MDQKSFSKSALSVHKQVALLQSRGMIVRDVEFACHYLQHLNYYRLAAYWLPFQVNKETHQFREGATFEAVVALYNFDRELRLLLLEGIERIEVSMRTQWAYHMSLNHGPHAHLRSDIAKNQDRFTLYIENMEKEVGRSKEIFIQHAREKYLEKLPAIWVISEVLSLGLLSKLYNNIKPAHIRASIATTYEINQKLLTSWLYHLTHIRNLCAHHSRIWNREFVNTPQLPKQKTLELANELEQNSRKLYNSIVIMLYFMDIIAPQHGWRHKLLDLLTQSGVNLKAMGFPEDWQERSIWAKEDTVKREKELEAV